MTPCQASVRLEMDSKPETGGKGWGSNGDMSLRCVSNCQDTAFDMEGLGEQKPKEFREEEVDIMGCSDDDGNQFRLKHDVDETDDGTEYSTSFGNTFSGDEDAARFSDSEVDSIHSDSSLLDGFDSMFRMGRKKVSHQWKDHIHPLTWRGKWIELKIRAMKSQLLKYERELASYGQRQPVDFAQGTSEGVKSLPFCGENHKKEIMKRKKRKRVEDMVDISSYTSQHRLFAYFDKKSDAEGPPVDDDPGTQAITEDAYNTEEFDINFAYPSVDSRDENSLERVLWKIETVQSRVQKLKTQIEKLITENAGKFALVENLTELAEDDVPTSPHISPALSPGNAERIPTGAMYSPAQHMADYQDNAVLNYGEGAPHPDIIECTIAPLSEEVRLDQSYFIDTYQNNVNDTVMHEEARKELHEFERGSVPPVVMPGELVKVKEETVAEPSASFLASKPEPSQKANTIEENSVLKSSLPSELQGPSTKRKRGERKAGSGTWAADKIVTQILS